MARQDFTQVAFDVVRQATGAQAMSQNAAGRRSYSPPARAREVLRSPPRP